MIKGATLINYGPITQLEVSDFGPMNLLIGPNRAGKTIVLKALYCAQRVIELTGRGKNPVNGKSLLANKLYWTFQIEKLGQLVRKPEPETLLFSMEESDGSRFEYSFGPKTEREIVRFESDAATRLSNSIFIPAKEIISLVNIILTHRDRYMEFGFDETYYDLAKALTPPAQGGLSGSFVDTRNRLETILGGKIEYSKERNTWLYTQGRNTFDLNITSEGTKKLAILDTLIANQYLTRESVVFIDEPEAGLHPKLLIDLLEIIGELARGGIQFFIASHSYFVIKKLYLLAHVFNMSIPVISFTSEGDNQIGNLRDGMPENAIIDQSIKLYEEELSL